MKFWDSSAVVALFVRQSSTPSLLRMYAADPRLLVWWATSVECDSALARLRRDSQISSGELTTAYQTLDELASSWQEVLPEASLRDRARRLLRSHVLRAGDALQLAAAVTAAAGKPSGLDFVCLDRRLAEAAENEGFRVLTA